MQLEYVYPNSDLFVICNIMTENNCKLILHRVRNNLQVIRVTSITKCVWLHQVCETIWKWTGLMYNLKMYQICSWVLKEEFNQWSHIHSSGHSIQTYILNRCNMSMKIWENPRMSMGNDASILADFKWCDLVGLDSSFYHPVSLFRP